MPYQHQSDRDVKDSITELELKIIKQREKLHNQIEERLNSPFPESAVKTETASSQKSPIKVGRDLNNMYVTKLQALRQQIQSIAERSSLMYTKNADSTQKTSFDEV